MTGAEYSNRIEYLEMREAIALMPLPNFNSESSAFIKLSKYLDAQKEIFEEVG